MDAATKLRYTILDDGTAIKCHRCHQVSHNIDDVRQLYCGACQRFHEDEDLPLPEAAKGIAEAIAMVARTEVGQGREVAPAIFVLRLADGTMRHPTMRMGEPEERDRMAQETRLIADDMNADVVILLSEAWTRKATSPEEMAAMRAKYGDSIADMPDRQDILLLSVETAGHYWCGRAPITGRGLDRRCGEVVYELADDEQGRFTHFLATPAEQAARDATLAKVRAMLDTKGVNPDTLVDHDGAKRRLIDICRRVLVRHGQSEVDEARLPAAAGYLASLVQ